MDSSFVVVVVVGSSAVGRLTTMENGDFVFQDRYEMFCCCLNCYIVKSLSRFKTSLKIVVVVDIDVVDVDVTFAALLFIVAVALVVEVVDIVVTVLVVAVAVVVVVVVVLLPLMQ